MKALPGNANLRIGCSSKSADIAAKLAITCRRQSGDWRSRASNHTSPRKHFSHGSLKFHYNNGRRIPMRRSCHS
ncbi:MAG: hypothetical protein NTV22_03565, partial [bacterium]|nr:hypothetical protein [bacterium]